MSDMRVLTTSISQNLVPMTANKYLLIRSIIVPVTGLVTSPGGILVVLVLFFVVGGGLVVIEVVASHYAY